MRYIIIIIALLFASCKKEDCNCGTIVSDGIDGDCYWLRIENDCSGNTKKFCFDYDTWFDGNPGENFCVTNETSW